MASRLELLKEQFFDNDGDVLSGGLLYTYIVGTTTAKATYTTATGDVEQANPVVLDSYGRIPSDLYGDGYYKIVIKTSAGVTLDTIPSVCGISTTSLTTIGDYSGDLDAAITAISSTETTLYIDSAATLSANTTVPATCSVVIQKGGSIDQAGYTLTFNGPLYMTGGTIDNDAALTINGAFEAGAYSLFTNTTVPTFGAGVCKLNVLWFGADATAATASDTAVTFAIESAMTSGEWGQHSVYFPAGLYKFTTSGVLSDIGTTGKQGIAFVGDGMRSSRLYLSPSGADIWFYDTYGDTTERNMLTTFTDLAFFGTSDPTSGTYAGVSEYAKGFRFYGATHEQGFKFTRCSIAMLDTAFDFEGSNLASEIGFNQCKISQISDVVYYINNTGSLNHTFIDTDLETIWGDFIRVGASGGGAVKVYGGSWIAQTGASYSAADEYVLDVNASANTGSNAGIFTFNGVRFENHGNNGMLVSQAGGWIQATFRDCIFYSWGVTAAKTDWVKITQSGSVLFDACSFGWSDSTYYENYSIDAAAQYGLAGRVKWQNCLVHDDLSEHITFTNAYGRASATGCFGHTVGALTEVYAVNFDQFGRSTYTDMIGGANDSDVPLKTVSIMYEAGFPYNEGAEKTVKLPKGALIKAIRVQKSATGSSTSDYCLHIGNDDKSTVYVSSIPEDQKYTHRIDYERGSTSVAQLTTRTDNNTGVFTFQGGNHSISEADTVNVNWVVGGTPGRRTGMTVSSITMATQGYIVISLDGGDGDNLPAANSDCYLSSVLGFIDVGATDNERIVRMWSSNGDKTTAGGDESQTAGYAIVEYY